MSRFMVSVSVLSLVVLVALPVLYALGSVPAAAAAGAIQFGTIGWFVSAPFWIRPDPLGQ